MKMFDVQQVEISAPPRRAFDWIADPARLPTWTRAFESADARSAVMRTPAGRLEVGLEVRAVPAAGTVDWKMSFPDGSTSWAHSRVVELSPERSLFVFVLHAPPAPLEAIEGALDAQRVTLAEELTRLKQVLEQP
jgi:uncharacterized protein YndB with AHSA1/START domain